MALVNKDAAVLVRDAEAADKSTKQIDEEVEHDGLAVDGEGGGVGSEERGEVLNDHAEEADAEGDEGCLLIADARHEFAGGYAHDEVGKEVHHVAPHAGPAVVVFPDVAERRRHIGDERYHGKHEEHGDNSHPGGLVFLLHIYCFYSFFTNDD